MAKKIYQNINYETVYSKANHKLLIEYIGAKELKKNPTLMEPYPSKVKSVDFFAYLENYSDDFNPSFTVKSVYGRVDPIVNYQNTTRKINLSFKIPAADFFQSRLNLMKLSKLASFLYPVYEKNSTSGHHIKQPPIVRLKFGNIIIDQKTKGGLYGYFDGGISYKWDLNSGIFVKNGTEIEDTEFQESERVIVRKDDTSYTDQWYDYLSEDQSHRNRYYPKIVDLTLSFAVLHNHLLGHVSDETELQGYSDSKEIMNIYGFNSHAPMHEGVKGIYESEGEAPMSLYGLKEPLSVTSDQRETFYLEEGGYTSENNLPQVKYPLEFQDRLQARTSFFDEISRPEPIIGYSGAWKESKKEK